MRPAPLCGPQRGCRPFSWPVPAALPWSFPYPIREVVDGGFRVVINEPGLRQATTVNLYVDQDTGNDANPGTNPLLPLKTIHAAINKWTNATIFVKAGVYPRENGWATGVPFTNPQNVIGVADFTTLAPGRVISSVGMLPGGADLGTWSLVGGPTPDVYQATLAATPYAVIDAAQLNVIGVPTGLTLQASVAAVQATPGSWYWVAGVLYVRRIGSTAPDVNLRPLKSGVINGWLNTSQNLTVENIVFEGGGTRSFYAQDAGAIANLDHRLTFIDCGFTWSATLGGLSLSTNHANCVHTVTLIRCFSGATAQDGAESTTLAAGESVRWLEIDSVGSSPRTAGSSQNTSLHKAAANGDITGVRMGCLFLNASGLQNAADVGGTVVYNAGVTAFDAPTSFFTGNAGTSYLQGCMTNNTGTDVETDAAGGSVFWAGSKVAVTAGPGTMTSYVPVGP